MNKKETDLVEKDSAHILVRKLKRTNITSPSWNAISREEY